MKTRPLSKRARFGDAIVLSAVWSNMAGSGECELALVLGPRSATIWQWMEDYGAAEKIEMDRRSSWRDAIDFLASSGEFASCIVADQVTIAGSPRYIGQILAMAWSESEDDQMASRLLCRFPDSVLATLDRNPRGVFDEELDKSLGQSLSKLDEAMIEIDELPRELELVSGTPSELHTVIDKVVRERERLEEEEERARQMREEGLKPWKPWLSEIERRWRLTHPSRRYPGGSNLPPVGLGQLLKYAEDFALAHGAPPTGTHMISGKPNAMGGVVAELTVNFDELAGPQAVGDTGALA